MQRPWSVKVPKGEVREGEVTIPKGSGCAWLRGVRDGNCGSEAWTHCWVLTRKGPECLAEKLPFCTSRSHRKLKDGDWMRLLGG